MPLPRYPAVTRRYPGIGLLPRYPVTPPIGGTVTGNAPPAARIRANRYPVPRHQIGAEMTTKPSTTTECKRCGRPLNRKQAVHTRRGAYCRPHADRLPPHLRRPVGQPKAHGDAA